MFRKNADTYADVRKSDFLGAQFHEATCEIALLGRKEGLLPCALRGYKLGSRPERGEVFCSEDVTQQEKDAKMVSICMCTVPYLVCGGSAEPLLHYTAVGGRFLVAVAS